MRIEPIHPGNLNAIARLMVELWPGSEIEEETRFCRTILGDRDKTCFLAQEQDSYIGFIYLALRADWVEGTKTSPVAYVEGVYVREAYRKSGIGRQLIERGEQWGVEMGCTEYASDVEAGNSTSLAFHENMGFREANRIVCFAKKIGG